MVSLEFPNDNQTGTFFNMKPINYNVCLPIQVVFFDYVDMLSVQVTFGILYSIILLFGFTANLLTMYCLMSAPYHFGLNSKFLISLTLADLLLSVTSLPITALQIFSRRWVLGSILCRYVPLVQGGCFYATSFTLVAIAIERYLNVTKATAVSYCSRHILTVSLIWVFGLLISIPYAWIMRLSPHCVDGDQTSKLCMCGDFCDEHWPSDASKMGYGSSAFFIQFGLPSVVMAYCYCKVRRTVYKSVKRRLKTENLSVRSKQKLIHRKKRTSLITLLLLLCFIIPWLPMSVLNLLRDYKCLPEEYISLFFAIGHVIAMTSVLWNPLIYCLYNREFMENFKYLLLCKLPTRNVSASRNEETYDEDDDGDHSVRSKTLMLKDRKFKGERSNDYESKTDL